MTEPPPNLDDPAAWPSLIEAAGPGGLLVFIAHKLGQRLASFLECEDILQEAYVQAWKSRASFEWRGVRSFRSWLQQIITHRIHDEADRMNATKRGTSRTRSVSAIGPDGLVFDPSTSTTPSRAEQHRETAEAMRDALLNLPVELQPVVFGRIFEERTLGEIADSLGIGLSATKHRFRRGAELYRSALHEALKNTDRSRST